MNVRFFVGIKWGTTNRIIWGTTNRLLWNHADRGPTDKIEVSV